MKIRNYWNQYTYNIKRTHRHKVAYAVDEYKQFGYNTVDCITHDTDKMVMYLLGVPHDIVVKIHRAISEHHIENNRKKNIKSMFIDIHCSGEKPDKQTPFREYFYKNKPLQNTNGLGTLAKKKNFGENVPIIFLTQEVDKITSSIKEFVKFGFNTLKRLKIK